MGLTPSPTTLLFVPGDRPERFTKAVASGADAVIIDLEDSVAAERKAAARAATAAWLTDNTAFVRVNPAGTTDCAADLAILSSVRRLGALVLPKTESPNEIDHVLEHLPDGTPVVALVESAVGLAAAPAIAAHPAVVLLAFGNLDFAADCGITVDGPHEPELLPARAQLSYLSRAAGLPGPIDGVTAAVADDERAREDSRRAARLGYSGKLCVHPRQVPVVAQAFRPSADQVAWARRILGSVSDGVALVDGTMVDRPVILRARHILERT